MNRTLFLKPEINWEGIELQESLKKTKKSSKNPKPKFYILAFLLTVGLVLFAISKEREQKRDKEIDKILQKPDKEKYSNDDVCEVYALIAEADGWYPCYNCGVETKIFLHKGEVWKYGKTCLGQNGRYPNGFPSEGLDYKIIKTGTEKECLILEKQLIYAYPTLPECLKRSIVLLRPPGNKIDN